MLHKSRAQTQYHSLPRDLGGLEKRLRNVPAAKEEKDLGKGFYPKQENAETEIEIIQLRGWAWNMHESAKNNAADFSISQSLH